MQVPTAELRDVWSTTHFITSEQIDNWLQGIAVSLRLTQTVNPHLWLTVMMPCKVRLVVTNEVSLAGHRARPQEPISNAQNQIKKYLYPSHWNWFSWFKLYSNYKKLPKYPNALSLWVSGFSFFWSNKKIFNIVLI